MFLHLKVVSFNFWLKRESKCCFFSRGTITTPTCYFELIRDVIKLTSDHSLQSVSKVYSAGINCCSKPIFRPQFESHSFKIVHMMFMFTRVPVRKYSMGIPSSCIPVAFDSSLMKHLFRVLTRPWNIAPILRTGLVGATRPEG